MDDPDLVKPRCEGLVDVVLDDVLHVAGAERVEIERVLDRQHDLFRDFERFVVVAHLESGYGPVTLTLPGQEIASEVAAKHRILKAFFVDVLGVNRQDAQRAACRAEHALGGDIIGRLLSFVEFVDHSQANGRDLVKEFQQFCTDKAPREVGK